MSVQPAADPSSGMRITTLSTIDDLLDDDDMKKLNDAIYQRGQFDLVFDGITEYPKAKYLIFSRNNINAYRAPILVEKEDDFIKAISLNPEKYRGRKLKITWTLRNPNEAVYVSGGLP